MIPIQALTCLLYAGVGLIATLLFLKGNYDVAFVSSIGGDSRVGGPCRSLTGRLPGQRQNHGLQLMEILAITFALALTIVLPSDRPSVSVSGGYRSAVAS